MNLKGKVVIVTGASSGIGMGIALFLGRNGAHVVVNYLNNKESAIKVSNKINDLGGKSFIFKCDVGNKLDVDSMVYKTILEFGKIDVLINNAGIYKNIDFLDRSLENWNTTFNTNLTGAFLCSQSVLKYMLKRGSGNIINISSINGTKFFDPNIIDYDITKSGLITLTKSLSKAFGNTININCIAPGNISTFSSIFHSGGDFLEDLLNIDQKKFGKVKNIADLVLFLISDKSSYISGEVIYLDGGYN